MADAESFNATSDFGSPEGGPGSSVEPLIPVDQMTTRDKVEEAAEVAENLFSYSWGLLHAAGDIAKFYVKIQNAFDITGALEWNTGGVIMRIGLDSSWNSKRINDAIQRCRTLLESLGNLYDAVSCGPLKIGPVCGSNAHCTSLWLAEHLQSVTHMYSSEQLPLYPEVSDNDQQAVIAALPRWHENAERFKNRLVAVVGPNYTEDFEKWINVLRVESAKALSTLPPEVKLSVEETLLVNALRKHGKPLTQAKICAAANLNPTGSRNALLAAMAERGVLRSTSKGYRLPEWDNDR